MSKNYLLLGATKKKFKNKSNLFYFNNFSLKLFSNLEYYNNCTIKPLLKINKKKDLINFKDINFIKRKVNIYLKIFTKKLNFIHNQSCDTQYWGLIIKYYLFIIVNEIFVNYKILSEFKKKKFSFIKENIFLPKISCNEQICNLASNDKNFSKYIKSKIISNFFYESKNYFKYYFFNKKKLKKNSNYINKILIFLVKLYIKIIKPILIINPYFGVKNSLFLIFKSYGKILILSKEHLFNETMHNFKFNPKLRNQIMVEENDEFDRVFNSVNFDLFPGSFLENYKKMNIEIKSLKKDIKVIGSSILLYTNDYYKILAAYIRSSGGKIINFQHGGGYDKYNFFFCECIEKEYVNKSYYWHQKDKIGNTYLPKIIKYKNYRTKKTNKILFLPTKKNFHDNTDTILSQSYLENFDPFCNINLKICNKIDNSLLKKIIIKLQLDKNKNSEKLRKIWSSKISKQIKICDDEKKPFYSYSWLNRVKIIVLDNFTTPFYEAIYLNIPVIIVTDELRGLKSNIVNKIKKLKKINVYFSDAERAASFINQNYFSIEKWWIKVTKTREFNSFKKELFNTEGFNPKNKLRDQLLKLIK